MYQKKIIYVKVYIKIFTAFGYVPNLDPGCGDVTK